MEKTTDSIPIQLDTRFILIIIKRVIDVNIEMLTTSNTPAPLQFFLLSKGQKTSTKSPPAHMHSKLRKLLNDKE